MTVKSIPVIPLLISTLFLLAAFMLYGSAGHDDSHITFWASYTLSELGEILNYNGDRTEQSSSLLLVLFTALLSSIFGNDVVSSGYLFTYLCGPLALMLSYLLAKKILPDHYPPSLSLVLIATAPAFLLWNTSGMESTLAAVCMLGFVLAWGNLLSQASKISSGSITVAAIATSALLTVRPEMISLCAALIFLLFIWRRHTQTRGNVPILVYYSTILLCICILVGWRFFYFGQPMPLPVYAKVSSLGIDKLQLGIFYLLRYGILNLVFLLGLLSALVYLVTHFREKISGDNINYYALLCALICVAYSGFILLSGGDWMQMGRFLVPVLPLAAIMLLQSPLLNNHKALLLTVLIVLTAHLYGNVQTLDKQSHGTPLWAAYHISPEHQQQYSLFEKLNQEHLRDMEVIDTLDHTINELKKNTTKTEESKPIVLISGQSGMVFFYTAKKYFGEVQFIDNRGLVEKSLLKCRELDDIPRGSQGLRLNHSGFFSRFNTINKHCDIPRPDIIYDINDMTRQLPEQIAENHYTLIHQEGGKLIESESSLPINALPSPNFVMVDNQRYQQLGKPRKKFIRYKKKPLVER